MNEIGHMKYSNKLIKTAAHRIVEIWTYVQWNEKLEPWQDQAALMVVERVRGKDEQTK